MGMVFVVNVVHNVISDSFQGIYYLFQAIINDKRSQFSVMNDIVNDKKVTIL